MKNSKYILLLSFLMMLGCSATSTKTEVAVQNEVSRNSKNEKLAQDHFIKGAIYDLKGEYHAAILEYQDALVLDEQAGIHYILSKDYLILQKLVPALKHSQKAVELGPDDVEYNFLLGSIYRIAQQPDSSEKYFEKVIELDSLYFQAYYSLAQLNEANRPLKSLDLYNRLLELTGPEWSVLVKIAELNERLGYVDRTINTVEELLKLNPSNLKLQKLLIESYIKTDKNDEALVLIDDALTMFPDDLSLIEYRGNVKANQKKWSEAADVIESLVKKPAKGEKIKPKQALLVIDWAIALRLAGRGRAAMRLRYNFMKYIKETKHYNTFNLLTSGDEGVPIDYRTIGDQIKEAETFTTFMSSYIERLKKDGLSKIN